MSFLKKYQIGQKTLLNKKGFADIVWHFMFDLLITIIIFIILLNFVDSIGDSTAFEKIYLSKDIGLILNTLQVPSGNVEVKYPQQTFGFGVKVKDFDIDVFDPKYKTDKRSYTFVKSKKIEIENAELAPKEGNLVFCKKVSDDGNGNSLITIGDNSCDI